VLTRRGGIDALTAAAGRIQDNATALLQASEALLDQAGSAGIVMEFQQRADRLRRAVSGLPTRPDPVGAADAIAADAAFLREIVGAFGGEDSGLDIRPLTAADGESLLVPMQEYLADMQSAVEEIRANAVQVDGLAEVLAEAMASAGRLGEAFAAADGGKPPGVLGNSLIPLALIVVGILLIIVLVLLNAKSAVFEKMAREQAEQNDRNQQAILRLLDEMGSLADGDLTVEATVTEDITGTIADSFNYAIEELRKLVATVNETAIMVDSAAKQTESTAVHMAKAAENQAREINAATESIVSMAG